MACHRINFYVIFDHLETLIIIFYFRNQEEFMLRTIITINYIFQDVEMNVTNHIQEPSF